MDDEVISTDAEKKVELLYKLHKFMRMGYRPLRNVNIETPYEEILYEYEVLKYNIKMEERQQLLNKLTNILSKTMKAIEQQQEQQKTQ